jgi:hypothetical protein
MRKISAGIISGIAFTAKYKLITGEKQQQQQHEKKKRKKNFYPYQFISSLFTISVSDAQVVESQSLNGEGRYVDLK